MQPSRIIRLAGGGLGAGFENLLMSERERLVDLEHEGRGIPPYYRRPAGDRMMQAGSDRATGRNIAFGAAI